MEEEQKHPGGRPRKFETPSQMQEAIDAYFEDCKLRNAPKTMTGLAIALGFDSRSSLVDYKGYDDEFSHTIKKARYEVEKSVEELMLKSSGVVAGVIFNAKNNFGWRDKSEIDLNDARSGLESLRKLEKESLDEPGGLQDDGEIPDAPTDPGASTEAESI